VLDTLGVPLLDTEAVLQLVERPLEEALTVAAAALALMLPLEEGQALELLLAR
jgi:hypothetical protein